MRAKIKEKDLATGLRKLGLSYSEIQKQVPVSSSSLSLWLHKIKLSGDQKFRLFQKGEESRKMGSAVLKKSRIDKTRKIISETSSEIRNLDKSDLMLFGLALYWAEGSKQKEHDPSKEVIFSNSDPAMIKVFLKWLERCVEIPKRRIIFEVYIHETYKRTPKELLSYWSALTRYPLGRFKRVYFKKNKVSSFRKNRGVDYHGVLRIYIRRSTDLNRKITGWIKGVQREFLGKV